MHKMKHKLRNVFLTGIFALLPIWITYLLLAFIFRQMDGIFQPLMNHLLREFFGGRISYVPGLGIFVTLLLVMVVGFLVTNVLGRKLVEIAERLLCKIPLVSNVYNAAKQFFEAFSPSQAGRFNRVVLVEYPRKGLYAIGFVTGETEGEAQSLTKERVINVFCPTTPNPTSGMLVLVPKEQVIPLSMSVEEGIKMIVSGGVITPPMPQHLRSAFAKNDGDNSPTEAKKA